MNKLFLSNMNVSLMISVLATLSISAAEPDRDGGELDAGAAVSASEVGAAATVVYQERFPVRLRLIPATGGRVVLDPAPGVDGGYAEGTEVKLTALPESQYRFTQWAGDVGGLTNVLKITVTKERSITVYFQGPGTPARPSAPVLRVK